MNYQHSFHACNFADVLKHLVFLYALDYMKKKPAPFFVLDTHAGAGLYDLQGDQANKTNEAFYGVLKLRGANVPHSSLLKVYLDTVEPYLENGFYPGSPQLAADSLRPQDVLRLTELHPVVFDSLAEHVKGQCAIHRRLQDGYEALRAYLPPQQRRGIVLIDPPFEDHDEFSKMTQHIEQAFARFSQGIFLIWYPIKDKKAVDLFRTNMKAIGVEQLDITIQLLDPLFRDKLNHTGLYVLNPPYLLDQTLEEIKPMLQQLLGAKLHISRF